MFLDVFDRLGAGIFIDIEHDQAQRDLERCGIGQIALLALFHVELRLFQLVFDELENGGFVEILDREDRLKDTHDAFAFARRGAIAGIQKQIIGRFLNLDEVRHLEDFADFAEVFADSLLACVGLSHALTHLSMCFAAPLTPPGPRRNGTLKQEVTDQSVCRPTGKSRSCCHRLGKRP